MKIRFLLVIILVFLTNISVFAGFKGIAGEKLTEKLNKDKIRLLQEVKFTEEDLKTVYDISWFGDSNTAYDICCRMRKVSTDKVFLEKVKFYQNIALIRILIENGSIISINQLPSKSMGFFDQSSIEDIRYATFSKDEESERVSTGTELPAEEIVKRYTLFMDKICTYSLAEKYPLAVEKLFWDYINKHSFDGMLARDIVWFLLEQNETKRAYNFVLSVFEKYPNENYIPEIVANVCIKVGEIDVAFETINYIINNVSVEDEIDYTKLKDLLALKAKIYEITGTEKENKAEIEKLTNRYIELLDENERENNKELIEKIKSGEWKIAYDSRLIITSSTYSISAQLPFIKEFIRIYESNGKILEKNESNMPTFRNL